MRTSFGKLPSPSATLTPLVEEAMVENFLLQYPRSLFMDPECKIDRQYKVPSYQKKQCGLIYLPGNSELIARIESEKRVRDGNNRHVSIWFHSLSVSI